MSVIVNYLKSRIEILVLNAKTGMDTTSQEYDQLCQEALLSIKQVCLGVKGVSPQELTELLEAITLVPMSGEIREELRVLFNQKLSTDPNVSCTRCGCTKVDFPENYLRQEDWDKLLDQGVDVNSKLVHLATFWSELGLEHPTEVSAKNIAALGVLTEADMMIAGPVGLQHLRTFKKLLKDFAVRLRAFKMISNSPGVFTGFVDQLQRTFPMWYNQVYTEDKPPVGCPLHVKTLVKKMQAMMGCRSTRTGCGQIGAMRTPGPMMNAMQMLMCSQQRSQNVQHEQTIPGLVVFPKGQAQSSGPGLPGQLALPAPGPDPAQPAPQAADALVMPAPLDTAAGSQGLPGSKGAVAQHVAALQGILAKRKKPEPPSDHDTDDGLSDGDMQADTPKAKGHPAIQMPANKPVRRAIMKRPAAAKPSKAGSSSGLLAFPGTTPRAPLVYGNSKVYITNHKYRLKEQIGDRVDKGYSFKVRDAKEVWKDVAKRLQELNP